MSKLTDRAKQIAEAAQERATIDKTNKMIGKKDDSLKTFFKDSIPEDLSEEIIKNVDEFKSDFIAGNKLAFGNLSLEAMAKDSSITRTSAEIPMSGRDSLSMTMDRHRQYVDRLSEEGKENTIDKYGVITTNYKVTAGRNSGQMKEVGNMIAELALKKLK